MPTQHKHSNLNSEMEVSVALLLTRMDALEHTIGFISLNSRMYVKNTPTRLKIFLRELSLLCRQMDELILKALAKEQPASSMKCLCKPGKEANQNTQLNTKLISTTGNGTRK